MDKSRLLSIQGLRAFAFIFVFLSHIEIIATGPAGVSIFFVLSGFCMAYAYTDRSEELVGGGGEFAAYKIKKLYPLHVSTLLFVALVMAMQLIFSNFVINDGIDFIFYFIINFLLLQSWLPWRDGYFSFNAVSWYLSTIAFSYYIFPHIHSNLRKNDKKRIYGYAWAAVLLMIIVSVILGVGRKKLGWTTDFVKWMTYVFPVYRAGDFLAGTAAGYHFLEQKSVKSKGYSKVGYTGIEIVVIILIVFQSILYERGFRITNWTLSLFWLPTSVAIVYLFARCCGMISIIIAKSRFLLRLGDVSGEAFLIHHIMIKATGMIIGNLILMAVASFLLTILAVIGWRKLQSKWLC